MDTELFDLIKSDISSNLSSDKLEEIRNLLRTARDLDLEILDSSQSLERLRKNLQTLKSKTLPDAFAEIGIDNLGLAKEGNLPAYDAKLKPYYKANIPKDKNEEACNWLEDDGSGDIIKRTITIRLGRDELELADKITSFLAEEDIDFSVDRSVPWSTLTAWVRERINQYAKQKSSQFPPKDGEEVNYPPLDLLGAIVGQVVDIKERKDE